MSYPAQQKIISRGQQASLISGSLPELISPYISQLIQKTGGVKGPIGLQFIAQPKEEQAYTKKGITDPLIEDENEVAPGLIYKYPGRALWTISRFCATYCRFCTRGREVGLPKNKSQKIGGAICQKPYLDDQDIKAVFRYIKKHPKLTEIILSGGDPLVSSRQYLTKIITGLVSLQKQAKLKVIRIGTRLPITNPEMVQPYHYKLLAKITNPYLMVHINHPAELTRESLLVLTKFRKKCLANVLAQTVLLKGVNDSVQTLTELFNCLTENGIRPYYLYQNDPVYWAKHFTVPIKQAIALWQKLRPKLSGLSATARFVIDTPFGHGKIPLPEANAWKVDYSSFLDFSGIRHSLLSI